MTATLAPRSDTPDDARARREALCVAAVTVWDGSRLRSFAGEDLTPGSEAMETIRTAAIDGPAWLDLNLDRDVQEWLQPWDDLEPDRTDWSPIAAVAAAIGLELPTGDAQSGDQALLRHLPLINEYAVLRGLTKQADPDPPLVMPLVGLIPADELVAREEPRTAGLEFVLLRVNLAVVGDCLVTIRLTDRLCSGSRECDSGLRLRAADYYEPPQLAVFDRFLPRGDTPSAIDMGLALAGYLAATCSTVAESAGERMRRIERDLMGASPGTEENPTADCHTEMLTVRATLEPIDDELLRLVQRLSDPEDAHPAAERARRRYEDARSQLDSVDAEIRWASDAATNRAQAFAEHRQKRLERVIAVLGAALVIAALVPSLFGENVKLPHPKQWADFIGMVMVMLGTSGVVFCALLWMLNARKRITVVAAFDAAATLLIVAGVLVLRQGG